MALKNNNENIQHYFVCLKMKTETVVASTNLKVEYHTV